MNAGIARILMAAGPTGGHLCPAIALAEFYRKSGKGYHVVMVTGRRAQALFQERETSLFDRIDYLEDFPYPRRFALGQAAFLLKLIRAFGRTFRVLRRTRPDIIIGFGSYISFPSILLGRVFGIPCLLHEQNAAPGKATKALARYAKSIAVSFEETKKHLSHPALRVTGLPLRETLVQAASSSSGNTNQGLLQVLVIGGSQGARRLNDVVPVALKRMSNEVLGKIAVKHITGSANFEQVSREYSGLNMKYQIYSYCHEMDRLYQNADLAITRAGASTLFELALFGLPGIVVPYPFAESHQRENAESFQRSDAVLMCADDEFKPVWLANHLTELIQNPDRLSRMASAIASRAIPDAARQLADLTESLLENRR